MRISDWSSDVCSSDLMSQALKEIADALGLGLIYMTSFDKANRTSIDSPRGFGMDTALPVFQEVREKTGCPVLTAVHEPDQCADIAEAVDVDRQSTRLNSRTNAQLVCSLLLEKNKDT